MPDNSKYAYIVGRLRALDTKMMNQNSLERLVDAGSADEAYRALNDLPLVMGSMGDYKAQDFNKVLIGALQEMKNLFIQMAPYKEALNFLWYKYDFHNLKVILKAKLTERGYADISHALIDLGTISFEDWEKHLLEDKKIELSEALDKAIHRAKGAYEKTNDPQVIDQTIDQHYLESLKEISDEMGSLLISRYLSRLIDFSNLRAFIRAKELNKDFGYFQRVLLDGGHVFPDAFLGSYERGYDELRQVLEKRMHADDLVVSLDSFLEDRNLLAVEKKAHELQQEFMSEANKISFGPEPVFAFFWRFENQLNIIRGVLVGKLNSLPAEEISKHVLTL
ncbi:V-type ATPase subunit [Patescibacteria group bacterium]|nr:V-type ATPase subunit [Patescibacteria group bacterium]MBU1682710.1 V-type ATPase subunit [Patescibacteria group bacterium]